MPTIVIPVGARFVCVVCRHAWLSRPRRRRPAGARGPKRKVLDGPRRCPRCHASKWRGKLYREPANELNCECGRCGHLWVSWKGVTPGRCPGCGSRRWDKEGAADDKRWRGKAKGWRGFAFSLAGVVTVAPKPIAARPVSFAGYRLVLVAKKLPSYTVGVA